MLKPFISVVLIFLTIRDLTPVRCKQIGLINSTKTRNPLDNLILQAIELGKRKFYPMTAYYVGRPWYPSIAEPGSLEWITTDGWKPEAGFYSGILWHLYRFTHSRYWSRYAMDAQKRLKDFTSEGCDSAYKIMVSFHEGLKSGMGHDQRRNWKQHIVDAVDGFIKNAYSPTYRLFRRQFRSEETEDKMDCLSVTHVQALYEAYEYTNVKKYLDYGNIQAKKLLQCLRPNGASDNVLRFNKRETVIERLHWHSRVQDSIWMKLQGSMILGFVQIFEYTSNKVYLDAAKKAADYFISVLPPNNIPYWSSEVMDLSKKGIASHYTDNDSAAATVGALGMLKLYFETGMDRYRKVSQNIIRAVLEHCSSKDDTVTSILLNGTGSWDSSIKGVATTWGDYYFLWYAEEYLKMSEHNIRADLDFEAEGQDDEYLSRGHFEDAAYERSMMNGYDDYYE